MSVHEINNLVVHAVRLDAAGPDGAGRAVFQVVPHQLAADSAESFVDRGDLGENVGAVSILFDHLLKTAQLPLDAAQALQVSRLHFRIDGNGFPHRRRRVSNGASAFGSRFCRLYHSAALGSRRHLISSGQARRARRSRKLFVTTLTELIAIAALATIGLSIRPVTGNSTPAAMGIPITL
jgi:hypothetical protein